MTQLEAYEQGFLHTCNEAGLTKEAGSWAKYIRRAIRNGATSIDEVPEIKAYINRYASNIDLPQQTTSGKTITDIFTNRFNRIQHSSKVRERYKAGDEVPLRMLSKPESYPNGLPQTIKDVGAALKAKLVEDITPKIPKKFIGTNPVQDDKIISRTLNPRMVSSRDNIGGAVIDVDRQPVTDRIPWGYPKSKPKSMHDAYVNPKPTIRALPRSGKHIWLENGLDPGGALALHELGHVENFKNILSDENRAAIKSLIMSKKLSKLLSHPIPPLHQGVDEALAQVNAYNTNPKLMSRHTLQRASKYPELQDAKDMYGEDVAVALGHLLQNYGAPRRADALPKLRKLPN